jgi:hypothetical protein
LWRPQNPREVAVSTQSKVVVDRDLDILLGAQIALRGLDGRVPQQKLKLQVAAVLPTQFRAGTAEVVGAEVLDPDLDLPAFGDRPQQPAIFDAGRGPPGGVATIRDKVGHLETLPIDLLYAHLDVSFIVNHLETMNGRPNFSSGTAPRKKAGL